MMDYIVLGQIPGTHIQISFAAFSLFLVASLVILEYRIRKQRRFNQDGTRQVEVIRPGQL